MGGNVPFIVFNNADLDKAVVRVIDSKFRNPGQTCVCNNRILGQEDVCDVFNSKLASAIKELHLGDGLDEQVDIGSLIEEKAIRHVEELVAEVQQQGAKLVTGGKRKVVLAEKDPNMALMNTSKLNTCSLEKSTK